MHIQLAIVPSTRIPCTKVTRSWWLTILLFAGVALLMPTVSIAQPQSQQQNIREFTRQLDEIDRALDVGNFKRSELLNWSSTVQSIGQSAHDCIKSTDKHLAEIKADLKTLGPALKAESSDVARQRRDLTRNQQTFEKQNASCKLASLRSDDTLTRINQEQKKILTQHLFARGPTVVTLLGEYWRKPGTWFTQGLSAVMVNSGATLLTSRHSIWLLIVAMASFAVGISLRIRIRHIIARRVKPGEASTGLFRNLSLSLLGVFGHYLPALLTSGAAAVFIFTLAQQTNQLPIVAIAAYGLPIYFLLIALIRIALDPIPSETTLHHLPRELAHSLGRRLRILVFLIFIGYLLFSTLLTQGLPAAGVELARALFGTIVILNLIWVAWLVGRIPELSHTGGMRAALILLLCGGLLAEWMGYRHLSLYVLRAVLGTLTAFALAWLLARLLGELFNALDSTHQPWQRWIRNKLGVKPNQHIAGIGWLRILAYLAVWIGFIVITLRIWGMSDSGMQQLIALINHGFQVGSLRIIPSKIMIGLLMLVLLFALNGWFKNRLEHHWLPHMRMDRGAREALVSISGYVGAALALIAALGIGGMDFGNLAIIAGALSVGIGFGLQNIVNNFVSGLILLFERPIKTGDWIVVGNTEGYVRRISIRSTQIQTFDRADVIVPNSELISTQVTNWMLHDPWGRVAVPIGVAYGTDTSLVKEILLKLANEHPLVIQDRGIPEPVVLFRQFGDSSLNFELRCFIRNIDKRLGVISDLNFSIDQAFREHGIEIPFPQRDLHMRNWPPGWSDKSSPEDGP